MTLAIESTAQALNYLYSLSLDASGFRFRGQARQVWSLQPSIYRLENALRYQAVLHEKFLLEAKPHDPQPPLMHTTFDLEWLMLCQHYGIPTRLLDWSTDVLVGLYFACNDESHDNHDGALFVCDQNEYPKYGAYNKHATQTQELAFVSTNVINPRMRLQSGCFMLWGNATLNEVSTDSYDLWEYKEAQGAAIRLEKISIPKNSKAQIRKELKQIYGISKQALYLEGGYLETQYKKCFDTLAKEAWLKTMYMTDAERLTNALRQHANAKFGNCENMFRGCISIGKNAYHRE